MNTLEAQKTNLQDFLNSFKLDDADSVELIMALQYKIEIERKEKEVLKKHKAKIFPQDRILSSGKKTTYYSTSAPWLGTGRKKTCHSKEALIEYLYDYYYPLSTTNESLTVKQVYEMSMAKKEAKGSRSSLTLTHNKADWKRYIEGRPLTAKELQRGFIQFKPAPFLDLPIKDLKHVMIVDFFDELIGNGNVTAKQVNNVLSVLHEVLQFAIDNDISCISPRDIVIDKSRCKVTPSDNDTIYNEKDRKKLLSIIRSLPEQTVYTLAIQFIFCMPLRIGELKGIKWSAVDLEQGYVSILGQVIDKPSGEIHRKQTFVPYTKGKKKSGYRTIQLSKLAKDVLVQLKQINGDHEYVFSNTCGLNPITTKTLNTNLKKYCEKAGITYHSSHKARFCCITLLCDHGANKREVQKAAGHSDPNMTEHYDRAVQKAVFDDEILEKACGFSSLD